MHSPDDQLARELNANPEFALFMLDLPIVVQRAFIPLTGRVTAALMLSWAIQVTDEPGVAVQAPPATALANDGIPRADRGSLGSRRWHRRR